MSNKTIVTSTPQTRACAQCRMPLKPSQPLVTCPLCCKDNNMLECDIPSAGIYCSDRCRDRGWVRHRALCGATLVAKENECLKQQYVADSSEPQLPQDSRSCSFGVELDRLVLQAHALYEAADYLSCLKVWREAILPSVQVRSPSDRSVVECNVSHVSLKAGNITLAVVHSQNAVSLRRTSWPLYRLGLALTQSGDLDEAIRILYEGLFALPEAQQHAAFAFREAISSALIRRHPNVRLAWHSHFQRTLVAGRPISKGSVVLSEAPLLRWIATSPENCVQWRRAAEEGDGLGDCEQKDERNEGNDLQRTVDLLCAKHKMSPHLVDVLGAYARADTTTRKLVMSCVVPSLPVGDAIIGMSRLARDLSHLDMCSGLTSDEILKLLMINKVNAHRVGDKEAGIFFVSSKFTHSCEPNCMYDGYKLRYVALRNIQPGEPLTFSYFGSHNLIQSSEVRQVYLQHTHLFVCRCARCAGKDLGRGMKCVPPCRGIRYRTGTFQLDALVCRPRHSYPSWHCTTCKRMFSDAEVPLQAEDRLESAAMRLEGSKSSVDKNQFEALKSTLLWQLTDFGATHWTYLKLTSLLARYHINLSRGVGKVLAEESVRHAVYWGRRYLEACELQGIAASCPVLLAEYGYFLHCVCRDYPRLRRAKAQLAVECLDEFRAVFGSDTVEVAELSKLVSSTTLLHHDPQALCQPEVEVEDDEGSMLTAWEDLLTNRYVAALKQTPGSGEASFRTLLQGNQLPEVNQNIGADATGSS